MENSLIHNKIVKIKDTGFLECLFPQYRKKDRLDSFVLPERVMFVGRRTAEIRNRLESECKSYIIVGQAGDIDLQSTSSLVDFCYSKWDKKPTPKVYEYCETLDRPDLEKLMKEFWVTGKLSVSIKEDDKTVFDLLKAIPGSQTELLKETLEVLAEYPFPVLESSFLTMLARVKKADEQEVSLYYKKLLLQCNMQVGRNIKSAVEAYATNKNKSNELAFVELLLSLRGR